MDMDQNKKSLINRTITFKDPLNIEPENNQDLVESKNKTKNKIKQNQ
jgi:hypothetical protein